MYRVVITKEEDIVAIEQEWQQLYDTQDIAEAHGAESMHGYVDKKVERIKTTQMLDQRVEELDLAGVIVAVNNLNGTTPVLNRETADPADPDLTFAGGNADAPA